MPGPGPEPAVWGRAVNELIAEYGWDQPQAPRENAAVAHYNPATGEVSISIDEVLSWTLTGKAEFQTDRLAGAKDVLESDGGFTLISAHAGMIGEANLLAPMTYSNLDLGPIVATGTDAAELTLQYVAGYGQPIRQGKIILVEGPAADGPTAEDLAAALEYLDTTADTTDPSTSDDTVEQQLLLTGD